MTEDLSFLRMQEERLNTVCEKNMERLYEIRMDEAAAAEASIRRKATEPTFPSVLKAA